MLLAVASLCVLPTAAHASTADAASVAVSPDGSRVYVGFNGVGFTVFSRAAATGELTYLGEAPGGATGGGLFSPAIVVSPDGSSVYGVDGTDNALVQYGPAAGGLSSQQSYPVLADTQVAKDPVSAVMSPDGADVYVLTYGYGSSGVGVTSRGAISTYARDPATGNLTLAATTQVDCCGGVIDPIVSPDGKFVYIADTGVNGGVVALSRDPSTGALSAPADYGVLNAGLALAMSPDGDYVYEAGPPSSSSPDSSAISVLSRNASTGALTPVSQVDNGSGGVSGLSDMWSLAVSPDGGCLYATSRADNTVAAFTVNAGTGALTFVQELAQGGGAVTGLTGAREVTVSPDGRNVYVASPGDDGVAVFTRDPATCDLAFVQLAQDVFSFGTPTLDATQGAATLPVDVQLGGTLAASVSPLAASARRTAAPRFTMPVSAGTVDVPVTVTGAAAEALDRVHQLTVAVTVTFTATGGSPTTKVADVQLMKSDPTAAEIRAALRRVLSPVGRGARIAALVRNRGYRVSFAAPDAGRVTLKWYWSPPAPRRRPGHRRRPKPRPVLVADAAVAFTATQTSPVRVALTRKGRVLLKGAKRLHLTADAAFTLLDGHRVAVSRAFTVKR